MTDSSTTSQTAETITVVQPSDPFGRWAPEIGEETQAMLANVPPESRETVCAEAVAVLGDCLPPTEPAGSETGLVIGYVQSGKTMSFTTVSALAHDNGYQLVIVITGISLPLLNQSLRRLRADLRLSSRGRWKLFSSDALGSSDRTSVESALARWRDAAVPETERQSVLVAVMKNRSHLDRLIDLLRRLDLRGVPTLVIDDEADQAGLNTKARRQEQSAIYRRLLQIRQLLPHHTFLQYTATPQAPLLINLIDVLSPRFAQVLTPGPDYTGGRAFFQDNLHLIRTIPDAEIPTSENRLDAPPDSLMEAMRVFFLGVAAGQLLRDGPDNRSMMVHPSERTTQHADFRLWVELTMNRWRRILERPEGDVDRDDLIEEFAEAHAELASTVEHLLPLERLVPHLPRAIRETVVTEVNTRGQATPQIDWERDYAHILVGGQALDRGYTVEGLTVTYMPRGRGVGNADTIQQRARWFGYKADYLGYCRVYLASHSVRAYRDYVEHEEDVRRQLERHRRTGRPLTDWRRAFFLSRDLQPTRRNVLSLDYLRGNFANRWFAPAAPHEPPGAIPHNGSIIESFCNSLGFEPWSADPRLLPTHRHLVARGVPLQRVYEELLTRLQLTSSADLVSFTGLLLQTGSYLTAHPEARADVVRMRPGDTGSRHRTLTQDGEIENLFQGAYPVEGPKIYPGDRHIHGDTLTVQIHTLGELRGDGGVVATDVPAVAVWTPREMGADWISQDQGARGSGSDA